MTGFITEKLITKVKEKIENKEVNNAWDFNIAKIYLERIKNPQFKVGDILCRKLGDKNDCVPSSSIPKRFIIVHEDEYGLQYAFQICTRKNLSKTMFCITTERVFDYSIDPLYIECSLTGKDYVKTHNQIFEK